MNKYAAARPTLTQAFDLMRQPETSNIFYALTHTLVKEPDGSQKSVIKYACKN